LIHVEDEPRELVNLATGEMLPATVENAAVVLEAAREMKDRIGVVIRDAEAYLAEQSRLQGTKTFHASGFKVEGKGGESVSYDPEALAEALRAADCPEERIAEVVVATVSYSVNRSVLRQLVAANPDYKAAAELAEQRTETPLRFSVKRGG
jgi:hypothetical protein